MISSYLTLMPDHLWICVLSSEGTNLAQGEVGMDEAPISRIGGGIVHNSAENGGCRREPVLRPPRPAQDRRGCLPAFHHYRVDHGSHGVLSCPYRGTKPSMRRDAVMVDALHSTSRRSDATPCKGLNRVSNFRLMIRRSPRARNHEHCLPAHCRGEGARGVTWTYVRLNKSIGRSFSPPSSGASPHRGRAR